MRGNALLHFIRYTLGLDSASSSVTKAEKDTLIELARDKRILIEIGVSEGRTSRALRNVMHPEGTLWLIDPFAPGLAGLNWQRMIARQEIAHCKNGSVCYVRKLSSDAVKEWDLEYDFLFIDGDHAYEAVRRDWEEWSPFARPGGHIALHDSCCLASHCKPTDGPVRVVTELIEGDSDFELVKQVDSLSVFRRSWSARIADGDWFDRDAKRSFIRRQG